MSDLKGSLIALIVIGVVVYFTVGLIPTVTLVVGFAIPKIMHYMK